MGHRVADPIRCSYTGVEDAQPKSYEDAPEGLIAFWYTSQRSGGTIFRDKVYCSSRADFLRLMDHWNVNPGGEYVYREP